VGRLLVTKECVEYEKNCCWNARTNRQVRLKLELPRCQHAAVIARYVPKLVLPVVFGSDEEVPWQKGDPEKLSKFS
jgi:hypothetical protein